MSEAVRPIAEWAAGALELLGIVLIVIMIAWALVRAVLELFRRVDPKQVYREARQRLARGILLGLELLVGADIIHTVAVELTWQTVGVLAVIVLIRTFLSFSLEVEMTGSWPWQPDRDGAGP